MQSSFIVRSALAIGLALGLLLVAPNSVTAQQRGEVDPRVEQRTYVFVETGEEIPYGLFVSSKVRRDDPGTPSGIGASKTRTTTGGTSTSIANNQSGLVRPICPYPQYAEYDGSGNLHDASNWACTEP